MKLLILSMIASTSLISGYSTKASAESCGPTVCTEVETGLGLTENYCDDGVAGLADYKKWTACAKRDLLWHRSSQAKYTAGKLPPVPGLGFGAYKFFSPEYLAVTFNYVSDFLPAGRVKLIHPSGVVAKVRLVVTNKSNPYTGLLTGSSGLARLSLAANDEAIGSYTPGMAVKFLVNGKPSANIVAMYSLEGQGKNRNFFENDFTTVIDPAKSNKIKVGAMLFDRVKKPSNELEVSHLSNVTEIGEEIDHQNSPYMLRFVPYKKLQINPESKSDFRDSIMAIAKSGSVLYTVYGEEASQTDENGNKVTGKQTLIGELILESDFVASDFVDKNLFFQHFSSTEVPRKN